MDDFQRRHPVVGFPLAVIYKYFDDQGPYLAAIISYYAFVAIFPLLLIASSVLGFILQGNEELYRNVLDSALARFQRRTAQRHGVDPASYDALWRWSTSDVGRFWAELADWFAIDELAGLTPLEGLVMGTRSGDIDPAALFHLSRRAGLGIDALDELLNKRSGLLGLAGRSDMRDILAGRAAGEEAATLAYDVYIHRLRAYVGAYIAQLGGVDAIVFTAGVGENAVDVRADALATLGFLGVRVDPERNAARGRGIRRISSDESTVEVLVVPTDEELEIARQTLSVI